MKKYIFNGIYIVMTIFILVVSIQERWSLAILLVLLQILIQIDQIHDTLKARNKHEN